MSYHEEMRNLEDQRDIAEATLASAKNEIKYAKDRKNERRFAALRENPDLLAAHIAVKIRREGKSMSAHDEEFVRGQHKVGWNQGQWGEVFVGNLKPVSLPAAGDWLVATCSSTACIAGHAGVAVGYQMLIPNYAIESLKEQDSEWDNEAEQYVYPEVKDDWIVTADNFLLSDGSVEEIQVVAAELLALDVRQRDYLFAGDRSYDQVLDVLDTIAQGNYNWVQAWQSDKDICGDWVIFRTEAEYLRNEERVQKEWEENQKKLAEKNSETPLADWERELLVDAGSPAADDEDGGMPYNQS